MNSATRNMTSVFLTEEDRDIDANEFLDNCDDEQFFTYRRQIEEARRTNPTVLCSVCYQPVVLRGNTHRTKFFAHTKNSEDCPIKTTTHLTQEEILAMKYNGQKEGRAHRDNKYKIAQLLEADELFSDVEVERTFRETHSVGIAKRWRRPDISSIFQNDTARVVFELQVSTTFLDVIINREKFYCDNDTYIVWVFLSFDPDRFTTLDIAYANRANIFVFDREAQHESEQEQKLILKCFYRKPYMSENLTMSYKWVSLFVNFSDVLFDTAQKKIYFADTGKLKQQVLKEINIQKQKLEQEKVEQEHRDTAERIRLEQNARDRYERLYKRPISSASLSLCNTPSLGSNRNKGHRTSCLKSSTINKSLGNVVQCTLCGNVSKQKKVGRLLICDKCFQEIE